MKDKTNIVKLLLGISLVTALLASALPPIPQNPQYHQFADKATLLGIPNFWNVASNIPFVVVGIVGLMADPLAPGRLPELKAQYTAFFIGVFLTGLGSGYYHWNPNNQTLVWDRLPMTLSFMAFLCIVIGEYLSIRAGERLLWPLAILGVASVLYWQKTELDGHGDLRPYALVQFLPMPLIPLILAWIPSRFSSARYLWLAILAYGIAKLLEHFDHDIFRLFGFVGGHPLKHIAAAIGASFVYLALSRRQPREGLKL